MIRTTARTFGAAAVVALLAVGASACSGSEGSSGEGSPGTTDQVSTATTNARLGDLSDLDGSADGLTGGDLDCYDVSLAFVAISLAPANALQGGDAEAVAQIQRDIDTLRAQVPEAIAADFDAYAKGVEAYTAALEGIDLSTITDPATQDELERAGQALSTSEVTTAQSNLEAYFRQTCPS